MADEDLAPTEGAEALELAPETQEEAQQLTVEGLAAELGWAPKDQFKGDPERWKPADEFIRAGRDIQQTLSRELRTVRQEVERFGRVAADITEDRVRQRDQHWQAKLAEAVDAGDHEGARQATQEIAKLAAQQPAQPASPPSEVADWVSRNEWFTKDPLAAMRAREVTDRLAQQGMSVPQQLEAAERAIRKEFPEHFAAPAKQPPATQTGQSRKAAPSNRARGFADMPAESQQMARDMVRRNPSVTLEAIATSYWADVAKTGRA